jgi:hypothetical protein
MNYEIYDMDLHIGRRNTVFNSNITLSSGDFGSYKFRVNIIDYDGFEEGLDWVTSAQMIVRLPNDAVVYGVCDISEIADGIIIYNLGADEVTLVGIHIAEVKLKSGATTITSQQFKYNVIENLFNHSATISNPVLYKRIDLPVVLNAAKQEANNKPAYDEVGIGLLFPDNDESARVSAIIKMPHNWVAGSEINPHFHVMQAKAGQAIFHMQYLWFNMGDILPTVWTEVVFDQYSFEYVSGTLVQILSMATPISGVGKNPASMLKIRLYRHNGVEDTYAGDILADNFDAHVWIDLSK